LRAFPWAGDAPRRPAGQRRSIACELRVAERNDLLLDSRVQRTKQETKLDPNLKISFSHRHRPGRSGSLEMEIVSMPRERPTVIATELLGDVLGQTLGLRQSQVVLSTNNDR